MDAPQTQTTSKTPENIEAPIAEALLADPALEEFPTSLTRTKTEQGNDNYILNVEGGSVSGIVQPDGETVMVGDLSVEPSYEGQGRGTYLMRALGREMTARGF